MIKMQDLLKEDRKNLRYGCAMLDFTFPELEEIHKLIDPDHIYTSDDDDYGLERTPHITLLYGLHDDVDIDDIIDVYDDHTFYTCEVYNPSLFEKELYDVLKFDVREGTLNRMNKQLKMFPHTTDYPDYHPHLTIAYLKSGMGKKYVDMIEEYELDHHWLHPKYGVYSTSHGKRFKISIITD